MTEPHRRAATIVDLMILVAGAAFAFAFWRTVASMAIWRQVPDSLQRYYFQALGTVALLAPLSLTLLAIALLRAGRPLRGVLADPAGVVGAATLLVLIADTAVLLAIWLATGWTLAQFTDGKVLYYCRLLAEQTGMAIAAAAVLRAASPRPARPLDWVDLFAWALAAAWILLALASAAFTLL
ncbi:hypothetical protein [Paludisphaera rhizosphaerae]|uniref:hypothetical protein n=1 Tax=Paludisphaera rhizosphaerae TaxID=2711216 RepID=UPI0013EDC4DD|nr:hypothetical protein [Paludisphaera rhizosphaerae]